MRTWRWYGRAPSQQMGQGELVTPRPLWHGRNKRACPEPQDSSAEPGDLLLEEGRGWLAPTDTALIQRGP